MVSSAKDFDLSSRATRGGQQIWITFTPLYVLHSICVGLSLFQRLTAIKNMKSKITELTEMRHHLYHII